MLGRYVACAGNEPIGEADKCARWVTRSDFGSVRALKVQGGLTGADLRKYWS